MVIENHGKQRNTPVPEGMIRQPKNILKPEELDTIDIGNKGVINVASDAGVEGHIQTLGQRLEEKAQGMASQSKRSYRPDVISRAMYEIGFNAAKHGTKFSGDPISIGWALGPDHSTFTITDSGNEEFEPLEYARMPVEDYYRLDLSESSRAGITILVGRMAPGEKTDGLLDAKDIQWVPLMNESGDRIGTKVVFTVRSKL